MGFKWFAKDFFGTRLPAGQEGIKRMKTDWEGTGI
jgi:hypothetical protein